MEINKNEKQKDKNLENMKALLKRGELLFQKKFQKKQIQRMKEW